MHYQDLQHATARATVPNPQLPPAATDASGRAYNRIGKRAFDISIIFAALPFVVVIVTLLAICVALRGGSPFYTQDRVGRGGRIYRIWKLRTMTVDADVRLAEYLAGNPEAMVEWTSTQKLKKDPRITPFGRFLRRSSMDELPQLWNVLRGDMSLIGPRPMMPCQVELYPGTAYYSLRPGISGSWQVSARNTSSFADRALFDTDYRSRISFAEDLRILLATFSVVFRGTGY